MKQHRPARLARWVLLLGALVSCGDDASSSGQPSARTLYTNAIRRIVLEVDYARGAEPFTGDAWRLFTTNAQRLFQGANKTFEIPTTLAQMEALADVTGTDFTTDQVLAIARAHRQRPSAGDTATFYVVWLPGYFNDNGRRRTDVLGVSFGNTGVIAMFKPVINSTATAGLPLVARYTEQATLVHEFGHAVGLVNNGIPTASAHHDSAHGAHCTNNACTMHYLNEGVTEARQFALRYATTADAVLFGAECLADTAAMIAASR